MSFKKMVDKYNSFSLETLTEIMEQLSLNSKDKRKIIIHTIDERDGVWKNYIETIQFDREMKKLVNKKIKNKL
jgi:hypothetical protein